MGITFLTCNGLFAPLQQFVGWLAAAPQRARARQRSAGALQPSALAALPPRRPLRVVRVVDACHAPAGAGRMVISGRMADVCAELERLAALESDQALAPSR